MTLNGKEPTNGASGSISFYLYLVNPIIATTIPTITTYVRFPIYTIVFAHFY